MLIALIPLRGGSKSIPKKNIKIIAGKPLCAWVIAAARKADIFDEIYVSTDSPEIMETVKKIDSRIKIIERPAELATDSASTEAVMIHAAKSLPFEIVCTIQATSPLTTAEDFIAAYGLFKKEKFDSLLTGVRVKNFFWSIDGTPLNYDPQKRPRRQEFNGVFQENGAFYFTKRSILEIYKCRLGGKIGVYEMSQKNQQEIDEPEDWTKLEDLLLQRRK